MKIVTIVGARPQFIKASAVSRYMSGLISAKEIMIHTGQHFDDNMSDIFFQELGMKQPDYNLGISGGGHGSMTGKMLESLELLMQEISPDCVLVYGDTNSTLAGALAATKLHIPVAHVEAGLRSFNRNMPEEINRVLADHASDYLFAPTDTAVRNLLNEGISEERIKKVGDVMYDVALFYAEKAKKSSNILKSNQLNGNSYVLATIHREENADSLNSLKAIFTALQSVSEQFPVVLPLHPRTRKTLERGNCLALLEGLTVLPPVGYLDMVALERNATVIATDSGGVQKEAFFYRVPCVTLRAETEWTELVETGWNRLSPPLGSTVAEDILSAVGTTGRDCELYGSGDAAGQIVKTLRDYFD